MEGVLALFDVLLGDATSIVEPDDLARFLEAALPAGCCVRNAEAIQNSEGGTQFLYHPPSGQLRSSGARLPCSFMHGLQSRHRPASGRTALRGGRLVADRPADTRDKN